MNTVHYRHNDVFLSIRGWLLGRVKLVMHLRQLVLQVSDLCLVLLPLHLHLEQPDKPHNMSQHSKALDMHIHTRAPAA